MTAANSVMVAQCGTVCHHPA